MTYSEYVKRAEELEAQANELREKAAKEKEAEDAKVQFHEDLTDARNGVIDAILDYIEELDISPSTDEAYTQLIEELEKALNELENDVMKAKAIVEHSSVKYNGKTVTDEKEKLKRIFDMWSLFN